METVWAPWRMAYILSEKDRQCFFCQKLREPARDAANYVVYRGKEAFALLNIYPYNNGHLMIAPYAHVSTLTALNSEQLLELFDITRRCEQALREAMRPEGFNIGINVGKVAGAGVEDHLHIHIVPRWNGDTNYMTTISETRVIPQQLEDAYKLIVPYFTENADLRSSKV